MTSVAADQDEPLFNSAHEALRFAYAYCYEQYPVTPLSRFLHGHYGSGRGLYGNYGAAVAGSIKRIVWSLTPIERNILLCRYSLNSQELSSAIASVLPLASGALGTGVHSTRMIIEIVHYHFRRDKTMRQLCDALNMRRSSVKRRLKKIEAYLYHLENVASAKAEHAMSAVGVVK